MRDRKGAADLQAAAGFFGGHQDRFAWMPPQAGTVCLPRLLGPPTGSRGRRESVGAEVFCAEVLAATGVLLLPSTVYDYGDSHFRLGLGRRDFSAGLDVLDRYLQCR